MSGILSQARRWSYTLLPRYNQYTSTPLAAFQGDGDTRNLAHARKTGCLFVKRHRSFLTCIQTRATSRAYTRTLNEYTYTHARTHARTQASTHTHTHIYIYTHSHTHTVMLRYNAVARRHLSRPPYKRGALWDPVDLLDIVIPRQRYLGTQRQRERPRPRLEVELV